MTTPYSLSAKASSRPSTDAERAVTPKYKRILLKHSGEALMGEDPFGINRQTIESIVAEVAQVARLGVEIGVVIGGGNIFPRVAPGAPGTGRAPARSIGG